MSESALPVPVPRGHPAQSLEPDDVDVAERIPEDELRMLPAVQAVHRGLAAEGQHLLPGERV
eukprot:CAMPEP_0174358472 /NCGR_PEP_ID=MMETSP0811_2-20130205/42907_1 /TAXON_ID=73025 ORGANISM="Eutreptiella gymnastica-like, Strain CCMP1594" /NCGR_SAMPLE_ID=MMETSP0811_2 /ASSEMBLY_ACC=CAM_ASM_000667 /LENGTH=61 /DNA_ID=CAMNT_0015492291 /DNA_START=37 /DNA_END=218 /DNA_ORIENTATION=-